MDFYSPSRQAMRTKTRQSASPIYYWRGTLHPVLTVLLVVP